MTHTAPKTGELLLELLSEEIPARMQVKAAQDLEKLVLDGLKAAGLTPVSSVRHVTPRRLILCLSGLDVQTPDVSEERRGPRVDAPDKAVEGFLRSTGLTRYDLEERDLGKKGRFLFALIHQPGRATRDVLGEIIPDVIRKFPWPKSQRWGRGSLRWVRPLDGILCLFDGQAVPFAVDDIESGTETKGHRFHAPEAFSVTGFVDYRAKLLAAKVQIDHDRRQQLIADSCQTLASAAGLQWVQDRGLLVEVAGLVEWPVPMLGAFEADFLDVPEEVLILTLKQDQRYFVLRDPATGTLAPRFIFVANIEPTDGGQAVVAGNERVIRARLADARFFWEQDKKTKLADRVSDLSDIVFHEKLGTVADRVDRMEQLAAGLAHSIPDCDPERAKTAAHLSKADLVSQMVYEFPEVQGVMGRYYALNDGYGTDIADAVRDHYSPLGPSDDCPNAPVSIAVALAEKLDTLVGFFGIGQPPTGSKDPFALRRAALGVIRLILENKLRLSLMNTINSVLSIQRASAQIQITDPEVKNSLLSFLSDRLKVTEREKGTRHDLIDAVFAKGDDDLVRILALVKALQTFLATEDGVNLLAGYKRAANILKAEGKKGTLPKGMVTAPDLLKDEAELALSKALETAKVSAANALEHEDFEAAMGALATLRAPIDAFFDSVTVNADDPELRVNRLSLLEDIRAAMDSVADFSQIEG